MNKKAFSKLLIIFLVVILIILISAIIALAIYIFLPSQAKNDRIRALPNPATNLTDEQAVELFDETFVLYLLYNIGANRLHNPPLSSDTPKMEIFVGDDVYNAEVKDGSIKVRKGSIENEDIIIKTSKSEAVKMIRDREYITSSFTSGKSTIELKASRITLFSKGYKKIYDELKR